MIQVETISDEQWLVTVSGKTTTRHRVTVTAADRRRFGGEGIKPEELLEASFRFLLERESNTSILDSFELPVINRYFPEYESQIARYLKKDAG